jgi:hypothetical protein
MKNFLLIIFAVLCGALLFLGNDYWMKKTSQGPILAADSTSINKVDAVERMDHTDALITNWTPAAQNAYKETVTKNDTFKIAFVGSPAMGAGEGGWSDQVKKETASRLGDNVKIELFESDTTSIQFLDSEEYKNVLDFKPNLVLFEPFTLVDNSNIIPTSQNHESINTFFEELRKLNGEVVFILQPPHPLEGATFYPKQVQELKEFAEGKKITYLDHWAEWPADETLSDYLVSNQEVPNENGHSLWAEYMIDYFIAE